MPVNIEIFAELLDVKEIRKAPDKMTVLVRQEMRRHAKRFRKAFIKQLKGIDFEGGPIGAMVRSKVLGKQMTSFFSGKDLDNFQLVSRAGGFLRPYLTGEETDDLPVLFKTASKFFVHTRRKVLTFPRSVDRSAPKKKRGKYKFTVTERIEFQGLWDSMEPRLIQRIEKAVQRALDKSFSLNERVRKNG